MRASAIAVALALLLAAGGAGAGPVEVERAKALFRAGASAYKAGNFAAAVLAFEQAHDLDPKPAIRFSTAQALRRWFAKSEDPSHLQRALAYYREYLDEVKTGGRVLDASRAKNEIEILLAQLGVPLSPTPAGEGEGGDDGSGSDGSARARPPARHNGLGTLMVDGPELAGHRVVVDGQEQSGWPVFVELSPGRHDVLVEAPGYRPLARTTTAVAGQLTLVDA
ncbi:MAG: tetratricopeptide repeat protein, partial [Myxococcales bacterium]|nr:tetratricopeptide repeat protein [Myxococcales bacterium]